MPVKSYLAENLSENDKIKMVQNPVLMRNKWRERVRISADLLEREKDPEKIHKYKIMFAKQKIKLKEWEDKVKKYNS